MLTTLAFEDDAGKTKLTLTWEPYGDVTPEEIATFKQAMSVAALVAVPWGWMGYVTAFPGATWERPKPFR